MNNRIILAVTISLACSIGFIVGFIFNETYQPQERNLPSTTITRCSEVQELFDWYALILVSKNTLKDLESAASMEDVETLKQKAKDHGNMHIGLFRKKLMNLKKETVNPEALIELERSINKIETLFK